MILFHLIYVVVVVFVVSLLLLLLQRSWPLTMATNGLTNPWVSSKFQWKFYFLEELFWSEANKVAKFVI